MRREPDTRQLNAAIDEFCGVIERLKRAGGRGRQVLADVVDAHCRGTSITLSDIVLMPASGAEQPRMVHKPTDAFLSEIATLKAGERQLMGVD